ncbi:TraR/DksA family transcriptional regulator [Sulfurihydrogenibium yellowstonense]|jgi:DnaK suppressor protein|uniref:Transcriptional regulator, TraR/DksA family n=1 Tax=Sulfurihydrogenibium yellowstonense SS-5 TaxID=432331 RepID=C4FI77_9AQUI|nr:TraR/DksA family transcriptional regulator [Sulfurihydrogenibium yellowstonense]EEP61230.1 transcriptional regulator, TraR/DksA family [Sulfurihydrogenibium yellowstonense SS-5]
MDLEKIKKQLLEKREQILKSMEEASKNDLNEKTGVGDDADNVTEELSRETFYRLNQADRETLFLIDLALRKIENGTYGICEECGAVIGEKRLEAIPWVRLCIDCSQNEEIVRAFQQKNEEEMLYNIIPPALGGEEEESKAVPSE